METTTKLTREIRDKRVAVMRDVLKQLGREDAPLNAGHGGYLHGYGDRFSFGDGGLQPHIDWLQKNCQACMLGAAFLSFVRLYNNIPSSIVDGGLDWFYVNSPSIRTALAETFDELTLDLMESAYEARDMCGVEGDDHTAACVKAGEWGEQFDENGPAAARAIALNLISNDGEFILPPTP